MINYNKMRELDSHWKEVINLAAKYGFLTTAAGGLAILTTHQDQLATDGEKEYLQRQRQIFHINMEV